ncbi:MAG TPA: hypothetical protein PKD86_10230 [Gemmatales bacterium]|mgnify:CR=1 FL=1|nr:hypothetical protein [Gemmatales bacterium]HMP59721.1 hypothetical protein [Gemmatales bacterium]
MEIHFGFLVAIGVVIFVAIWMTEARAQHMLRQWAAGLGVELVSAKRCWLWRGPYAWRSTKNQYVYAVVVRDTTGQVLRGHVRLGGFFFGMMTNKVDHTWE